MAFPLLPFLLGAAVGAAVAYLLTTRTGESQAEPSPTKGTGEPPPETPSPADTPAGSGSPMQRDQWG